MSLQPNQNHHRPLLYAITSHYVWNPFNYYGCWELCKHSGDSLIKVPVQRKNEKKAVFLAKWTLDQIEHPWNPTLEHYTNYKVSDLKATVLALQDMQLNNAATLHAIRQKYRHKQVPIHLLL